MFCYCFYHYIIIYVYFGCKGAGMQRVCCLSRFFWVLVLPLTCFSVGFSGSCPYCCHHCCGTLWCPCETSWSLAWSSPSSFRRSSASSSTNCLGWCQFRMFADVTAVLGGRRLLCTWSCVWFFFYCNWLPGLNNAMSCMYVTVTMKLSQGKLTSPIMLITEHDFTMSYECDWWLDWILSAVVCWFSTGCQWTSVCIDWSALTVRLPVLRSV